MPTNVKKIHLDDGDHDISAKYILEYTDGVVTAEHDWNDIKELVSKATDLVVLQTLPEASETTYNEYKNDIVLIPDATSVTGSYVEYVILDKGSGVTPRYVWEKIGTTQTDLSNYVQKGTYVTGGPSNNATGEAGAATITTTEGGGQTAIGTADVEIELPTAVESGGGGTASGSATITYQKADNKTGETGSNTNDNTGNAGGVDVNGSNFNFNGTKATLTVPSNTVSVKVDKHVFTPSGTIGGTLLIPGHSHTVNEVTGSAVKAITFGQGSLPTRASFNYVSGVKSSDGTADAITELTDTTINVLTGVTYSSTPVFNSASVDADGVLSFGTYSVAKDASGNGATPVLKSVSAKTTKTVILNTGLTTASAYQITGLGSLPTLTYDTLTVLKEGTTIGASDNVNADLSQLLFNGAEVKLDHTQVATLTTSYNTVTATVNQIAFEYTPAGTIGGKQTIAAHSHTYVKLPPHTHSIALSSATVTGTAEVSVANHTHGLTKATTSITANVSVAISAHTHNVSIPAHTHSLNNHTHNVVLNTPTS